MSEEKKAEVFTVFCPFCREGITLLKTRGWNTKMNHARILGHFNGHSLQEFYGLYIDDLIEQVEMVQAGQSIDDTIQMYSDHIKEDKRGKKP